ncbi:MAG: DUF4160 domain-containing protein [Alphaproteobacteria bacterium]|nr:DUF4160 domain-containing protein [Alphaproteobacteria bacterium]
MPTVLRHKGYRFYFYSHEPHEPAHVHIDLDMKSAKFWLEPVALSRNVGYNASELNELFRLVQSFQVLLKERWYEHFGH